MKTNILLSIAAVVLCTVSVLSYYQSVTRAERFERGQKFLAQLNPDNIQQILITKEGKTVELQRGEDEYTVASSNGYPAKNESVNRFINDVINIELEKEIGSSESLAEELEVQPDKDKGTLVVLKNEAGKEMVRFMVGKASQDGRGSYVKRLDGDEHTIYLTSRGAHLASNDDAFLKKELLEVESDKLARIEGKDFVISKKDDKLALEGVPADKKEGSDVSGVKNLISSLRFENVFLADDPNLAGLNFKDNMVFHLEDESQYIFSLAEKDGKHYLKVQGKLDVPEISITKDESEEELKKKSDLLTRADEVKKFNNFHGSWVYEITEFVAKKFTKTKTDLLMDKETES